MPNLKPPITTTAAAVAYQASILKALPANSYFTPLMTLYLTDNTSPEEIKLADGGTNMPLLVHGEVTDTTVDIFDREKVFIDTILRPLVQKLPQLKVVMEHITTLDAVEFVQSCQEGQAIVAAVTSGSKKFFLGTDSAPHERRRKECSCGCAGIYSSPVALSLYAKVFEEAGALDKLEAFTSFNGPDFYGLPRNTLKIIMKKSKWRVPDSYAFASGEIIPIFAGQVLDWLPSNGD
ncbi:hypothetical protein QJS04_geneDACA020512 [Acorus gramineus]|uniref:dihydroorotase n=1 Tax=Acorus gramineus TaxID=55184 RepID=A0AAV9AC96_ACOGR|nr:hypothetical protein QJS04_geneDACA020512 [Acorus gramineus]